MSLPLANAWTSAPCTAFELLLEISQRMRAQQLRGDSGYGTYHGLFVGLRVTLRWDHTMLLKKVPPMLTRVFC